MEFLKGVDFISNEARSSGDDIAGYGGAVAVGPEGSVEFYGDAEFSDNKVQSGGNGGALSNLGSVSFRDFVDFFANTAESGGNGGAIANFGSLSFGRRSSFNLNVAAGIYNGQTKSLSRFMSFTEPFPCQGLEHALRPLVAYFCVEFHGRKGYIQQLTEPSFDLGSRTLIL